MTAKELWFPPGVTSRDRVVDVSLAVLMMLLSGISSAYETSWAIFTSLMLTAPLVLRRTSPLLTLLLVTLGGLAQLVAVDFPTFALLVVPIVSFSVARWIGSRWSRTVLVIGLFAAIAAPIRWLSDIYVPDSYGVTTALILASLCFMAVVTPYGLGRRLRDLSEHRQRQIEAAEERYRRLLHAREQQARLDESAVRTQIARELHDVVAHSLSVMVVQAEGAKALLNKKPEIAEEALGTIADIGRESLTEMRRIVGVLRAGPEAADYNPAPTLAEIPDLVQRASSRAHLRIMGQPHHTTPALELTVYRVVQEALTNFLKHAGPDAEAWVRLNYAPQHIAIDVVDNGTGVENPAETGGNGLRGMHERVASMGGRLTAAPRHDGPGFRVQATIPVRRSVSPTAYPRPLPPRPPRLPHIPSHYPVPQRPGGRP